MSVRDVFTRFRELHNLQHCESPAEARLLDRLQRDPRTVGSARLAAVCFGWSLR